ncbi:transposase [Roseovarius sp. M141]|uniref:transposase n=1 Tax=Roseovarius sp. M141 TaxID=2583806 RepID=UPI0020CEF84C|nr:transposase [Roseovarius sp. M141]MCQ0091511.1 IS1380 family transposase [Roseovarius sp. M141]
MDHPEGAGLQRADRVDFDPRVRLEFRGTQLSSDGGLLVMRELDDALGLSDLASAALRDTRSGKNTVHRLDGLFRQSVFGRLAGYEDVNDANRLACDPVMRQVVGGRAVDAQAASASQMGRFETETLALAGNRAALADLNGQWIDRFHDRNGLKYIVLDMDSSVSPTHGDQEGSAWNGHFDCSCYHPNFLFNQFGMLERCALRHGNVHSADGWRDVLDPVIARYAERDLGPSLTKVKRFFEEFEYQAASWDKERRVIAKIEWHPGELFPRVGFIVTNLPMEPDWVVRFYNQRGTAEQHIKEGKYAFRWTRLSCRKFRDNEVRLQLHALAYNLATFLRCIELPEAMADWSLTSLQLKLIKIGARVVRHARTITFQLAEVAVTGTMVRAILAAIRRLRAPPLCA